MKKIFKFFISFFICLSVVLVSYCTASDNGTLPLFYLNDKTVSAVTVQNYNGDKYYELNNEGIKMVCAVFSQMRLKRDFRKAEPTPTQEILNPTVYVFETIFGKIEIYEALPTNSNLINKKTDGFYWVNGKPYGTLSEYNSSNFRLEQSINDITMKVERVVSE